MLSGPDWLIISEGTMESQEFIVSLNNFFGGGGRGMGDRTRVSQAGLKLLMKFDEVLLNIFWGIRKQHFSL